ncbi:MAG TPA: hypothetical protein PLC84_00400 [Methanosarcina thermophila]|uniref:hypothetical protein n=1 Tax=Methanosarcina thermophila TaxID=2210 RepID=UPI0015F2D2CC|nr:hypothetical protein [Methanosarcina thermophila]NLU57669.1 hypothetical protein [Methanosarcina thermophila]HOA68863.1 hypothetical protein [Methanosarcina thermophila]HOQ64827.1 hypothetical protein [Methanosarcina thermophila]HPT80956.1 hypothetical protein [Methanosarcina thermophila]HPZ18761.1 hypothetical protein [Methanosarcina thermophila]
MQNLSHSRVLFAAGPEGSGFPLWTHIAGTVPDKQKAWSSVLKSQKHGKRL